jgi:hypothetical protein
MPYTPEQSDNAKDGEFRWYAVATLFDHNLIFALDSGLSSRVYTVRDKS